MQRINVVGTTASGKSTLAVTLADRLGLPYVELDELHWEPGWTEARPAVFRDRVAAAIGGDRWVVDGNYSSVRDLVWARADTVVWLDYPLPTILRRFLRRTFRRIARREELWAGNRERLATQFFSRDSLLLWILSTYRRRRREYPRLLAEHENLVAIRLGTPRDAARWLAGISPDGG